MDTDVALLSDVGKGGVVDEVAGAGRVHSELADGLEDDDGGLGAHDEDAESVAGVGGCWNGC